MKIFYSALDLSIPGTHGGSSHALETINSLKKLGHEVIVFCSNSGKQPFFEQKEKITFYRFPVPNSGFFKIFFMVFLSTVFVKYCLFFKKIDVIWERARIFGGIGVFFGNLFGKKTILELNEPVIAGARISKKFKPNSFLFKSLKNWFHFTAKKANIITVTHLSLAKNLSKEKVKLIGYGANPETFSPALRYSNIRKKLNLHKGQTVLYSGSFREWHALKKIVLSAEKIVKVFPKAKFLLIGSGPEFLKTRQLVFDKNLQNNVLFLGKIPYKKMPQFVNASDICLALFDPEYALFKKFDYFYSPIKVHEYKACGKPVIATQMGNLTKLVQNNVNGFTVKNNNPDKIAQKISFLIKNVSSAKKIGKFNRKEILEKDNWLNVTKGILNSF